MEESVEIVGDSSGYVAVKNGHRMMALFGDVPMWFESEDEAKEYLDIHSEQGETMRDALQSLKSNIYFNTGDPMLINPETIATTLNSDALFYPYPGPERVEQMQYFQPLRDFLEAVGFTWTDIDLSGPYNTTEAETIFKLVDELTLTQQAKLLYLMLNTQNLFIAPLAYVKGSITEEEFLQAWLFNNGQSTKESSKAYAALKELLDQLNTSI